MKRKILLYGDVDVNIVDGSSVWLISLAKLLAMDEENVVDVLIKKKIRNTILTQGISHLKNVSLLSVKEYLPHIDEVQSSNIAKVLPHIDALRDYSCIIVRGYPIMEAIAHLPIMDKVIPYLTDFCGDETMISEKEVSFLRSLYQRVKAYFVQTKAMKTYLMHVLGVDGEKFHILYPLVFDVSAKQKEKKTLVYAGKIAKDWNILELISIMEKLKDIDPEITLHMIGDKCNRDIADRKEEIFAKLQSLENVRFYGSLPKAEVSRIMAKMMIGYAFRTSRIDHDHSLELSIKLLEYCASGTPMLLRRCKMHEEILGADYPLFVENEQDCIDKLLMIYQNDALYQKLSAHMLHCFAPFQPQNIYQNILPALDKYPAKKLRLLISGHDLKFLKDLYPYFREEYELEVQELSDYMNFSAKDAEQYRKKADIIWCEWMLMSAEWYSLHRYPHQKLFIRGHRFEVTRKFGTKIDFSKVEKVITVSYYWFEEFSRRFRIPKDKVTVINNYIDVKKYDKPKNADYQYHIALIGALPKRKGLDRAVELLKLLKMKDDRYVLHVPGKRPEEFANTWNVAQERAYYEGVYEKIRRYHLEDDVIFDGWVDTSAFLKDIGYVLSLSDAKMPESFHLTPLEGIASKAMALALDWDGIEYIYPKEVICSSIKEMAERIEQFNHDDALYQTTQQQLYEFVCDHYDISIIYRAIASLLRGGAVNETLSDSNL